MIGICDDIDRNGRWVQWQTEPDAHRRERIFRLLINGANPNAFEPGYRRTPLLSAMSLNLHACAELLLDFGADPNVWEMKREYCPLGIMGTLNKLSCTDDERVSRIHRIFHVFMIAGADLKMVSPSGITPLMWVAYTGPIEAVKLLINAGADPLAMTNEGFTAREFAMINQRVEIDEYLASQCQQKADTD